MKYTNEQIANNLDLWDEYFNRYGFMSDDDFHEMGFHERLKLINDEYPENN